MSESESWGRSDGRRRLADRRVSERRLTDLADRLAEARRNGDPAPEELERLVDLLSKNDIDPGDRLTRALEGFADLSEERRASTRRAEEPRRTEEPRRESPAQRDPRQEPLRLDPARRPANRDAIAEELEARLSEFARTLPGAAIDERRREASPQPAAQAPARREEPVRQPQPPQAKATPTPPIASLRAALAEISAHQKALDDELDAPAVLPQAGDAPRRYAPRQPVRAEARSETRTPLREELRRPAEPEAGRRSDERVLEQRPSIPSRAADAPRSAPRPAAASQAPAAPVVAPAILRELRTEIDRLGNSVADLPTRVEIDRMTREMSDLAKRLSDDRPARLDRDSLSAIEQLVSEVDRMRSDAASPQIISSLAEELHAISARLDVLGPRSANAIESLARRVDEVRSELDQFPRVSAVDSVASEIQALIVRLDAQEAAVAPTREAVVGLSGRVQALDGRIAAIADASAARDEALERINATIRSELDSLPRAEAVTDLGRQIDALTEGLKSRSAIGPALKAVEGLSGKVEALDGKIAAMETRRIEDSVWLADAMRDEIAAVARPGAFDDLSRQIEELTSRIASERREPVVIGLDHLSDQIEALAGRLTQDRDEDQGGARLETITSRIDDLGDRFDTMAAANRARGAAFEQVEESIRAIADEMIASRLPEGAASSALEAHVVKIVEGLTRNGDRVEDLHDAFTGLAARIERSCADLGAHAVESAVSAARNILDADSSDGQIGSDFASALEEMRASSAQSERRAADALDAVRSTLERLLDRMENQPAPAYAEPVEPRRHFGQSREPVVENATEIARAAARRAMEEIADAHPPAAAREPYVDDAPSFRSTYGDYGPDDPIEPGSGLPRSEPQPVPPAPKSAASLIASARRATQQSSSDLRAELEGVEPAAPRSSLFSGALATLKKRRRPVLFGMAAVLIVFTALYVASGMTGEPEPAPAAPPAPQSSIAPSEPARVPTSFSRPAATPAPVEAARDAAPNPDEFASTDDPEATEPVETARNEPPAAPAAPVAAVAPPKAPARDLSNFAFAEASTAAAKSRTDWKTAEPASTGSIARDPNAIPDQIGGPTLKSRAKAGDAMAELEIGDRLLDGRNVPADPSAAARWFEKAAAQGLAPAQHRLGSLYEKGRGVPRDIAAARRWYEQAAASGNVRAMHNLGVVHAEGGLGKPDYAAAMVWFRMAAERGLNDSGYNLAVLAARGLGGKRDLVEAYKWFALAAQDGDEDAAKKRDEVGKALGSAVSVAQAAVAAFKPKPVDPAANESQTPPGGWDRVAARAETGAPVTR